MRNWRIFAQFVSDSVTCVGLSVELDNIFVTRFIPNFTNFGDVLDRSKAQINFAY